MLMLVFELHITSILRLLRENRSRAAGMPQMLLPGEMQRCRSMLRGAGAAAAAGGNDWEALCPELFALILKAVQQNARREAGEARRVVALAGVCRRWRQLIQQSYSSPLAEIGLLQFPFALRQPGPCNRPVQCLLKRKGNAFVLFQENRGPGTQSEKLDFLMAARKEWKAWGSAFTISASHISFSKSGHAYMGKLRSDIWGADFNLWEVSGNHHQSKRLAVRISFFDRMQEGLRQRAMACELFTSPKITTSSSRLVQQVPATRASANYSTQLSSSAAEPHKMNALERWSCFASADALSKRPSVAAAATFLRSYSSLRRANLERSNSKAAQLARNASSRSRELGLTPTSDHSIMMESRAPQWDEQSQCWSLDFHGRSSLPSHYSFQLIQPISPHHHHHLDQTEPLNIIQNQTVLLQLGKVGKGLYTVDFCHPLSAFQAFSICLSSFATKVGMDP